MNHVPADDRDSHPAPRWALVTGTRGTDRGGLTAGVLAALHRRGVAVGGFRQEVIDGADGERAGYSLRHLTDGELVTVATRGGPGCECGDRVCDYTFDPSILARSRDWIAADAAAHPVLLIESINRLEIAGKGHAPAVEAALATGRIVVLAARAERVAAMVERFGLDEPVAALELGAGDGDVEQFADELCRAARAPS